MKNSTINIRRMPVTSRNMFLAIALILTVSLITAGCAVASPDKAAVSTTTGAAVSTAASAAVASAVAASAADTSGQAAEEAKVVLVNADEALALLKDNPAAVLLDVRTAAEYADGHIADSQLLPVEELAQRASELPQDKATPIIVYCRSGRRSAIAAAQMLDMGYSNVFDLGGIQSWPYDIVK